MKFIRHTGRGVSICSSLGWPVGWPDLYFGGQEFRWHNTWLSEWCNLTPAMRCYVVNTGIMSPCYLATSFIGGHSSHRGAWPPGHGHPLRTASAHRQNTTYSDRQTGKSLYEQLRFLCNDPRKNRITLVVFIDRLTGVTCPYRNKQNTKRVILYESPRLWLLMRLFTDSNFLLS